MYDQDENSELTDFASVTNAIDRVSYMAAITATAVNYDGETLSSANRQDLIRDIDQHIAELQRIRAFLATA